MVNEEALKKIIQNQIITALDLTKYELSSDNIIKIYNSVKKELEERIVAEHVAVAIKNKENRNTQVIPEEIDITPEQRRNTDMSVPDTPAIPEESDEYINSSIPVIPEEIDITLEQRRNTDMSVPDTPAIPEEPDEYINSATPVIPEEIVSNPGLYIELKKGEYFNYGDRYFVEFNYGSKEQQDKIYGLFNQVLVNHYGSNSTRVNEGKDYIMPYFADENDQITINNTGKIGGTSIPEDLLPEFIRRFVEVDGATVRIGNEQIKGQFDYEQFNDIISNLGIHK